MMREYVDRYEVSYGESLMDAVNSVEKIEKLLMNLTGVMNSIKEAEKSTEILTGNENIVKGIEKLIRTVTNKINSPEFIENRHRIDKIEKYFKYFLDVTDEDEDELSNEWRRQARKSLLDLGVYEEEIQLMEAEVEEEHNRYDDYLLPNIIDTEGFKEPIYSSEFDLSFYHSSLIGLYGAIEKHIDDEAMLKKIDYQIGEIEYVISDSWQNHIFIFRNNLAKKYMMRNFQDIYKFSIL
ncbi:hypothetical protein [Sporolactobacillus terrae]|uniref:hypothetical protein n=1 Tax=Sporolactobacillus terrae TaxID=269673 RepID=UPI001CBC898E|nr:hypothetical protein [Sporolactobacillus terrae]UAK16113.1 hypothetical protein K7399_14270 [Sporolactobacillus terrae]